MHAVYRLATLFDRHVAATRDEPAAAVRTFAEWLAAGWRPSCPPEPTGTPAATSRVGYNPAGIRWYRGGGRLWGYAGGRGCYCLSEGEAAAVLLDEIAT